MHKRIRKAGIFDYLFDARPQAISSIGLFLSFIFIVLFLIFLLSSSLFFNFFFLFSAFYLLFIRYAMGLYLNSDFFLINLS